MAKKEPIKRIEMDKVGNREAVNEKLLTIEKELKKTNPAFKLDQRK